MKEELLLREYEQCCENIRHNNTRLWSSAVIFAGSFGALAWLSSLLESGKPLDLIVLFVGSLLITLALYFFLRFFMSLEYFDRVEYHRAVELERELKFWRTRYLLSSRESTDDLEGKMKAGVITEAEKEKAQEIGRKIQRNISKPNVFSWPGSSNKALKLMIISLIVVSMILALASLSRLSFEMFLRLFDCLRKSF